jgi:hypothetical protein
MSGRLKCEWSGCKRNATHMVVCEFFIRGREKLTCRNHPNWAALDHRKLTPAEMKQIPAWQGAPQ